MSEESKDDIDSDNQISCNNNEDSVNHELSENGDEHRNNFVSFPSLEILHEDGNDECQSNGSGKFHYTWK